VEQEEKSILDMCCGSKMFWFDKEHPEVLFGDIRTESHTLCDGRDLSINPDMEIDFTDLPFQDNHFKLVVFDPPHLKVLGKESWMAKKYGVLKDTWQQDIASGFAEAFRVLKPDGVLIFKWNETQIKVGEILKLTPHKPLFGHISGKRANTHWLCFLKPNPSVQERPTNEQ
jgi:ubiquinone/menaquinone biosynthesis C-methylase UbiE